MTKPTLRAKPRVKLPTPKPRGNLYFTAHNEQLETIHTGCELLNCVLGGGYFLGRITNTVGDKSTGKTLLAIEAMVNFFKKYPKGKCTYCETEAAFDDPYAESLGLNTKRVLRPQVSTVEELFEDLQAFIAACKESDVPGLYVVDSLDALSDAAEQQRKISDSTYGASKPKQLGQLFRRLVKPLETSRVCVIIISQVRDAIGVTFGNKQTRSGGKALDFYASQVLWLAHISRNKRTVKKVNRVTGVTVKAKTEKNKMAPPFRECQFDIVFGYGIDDISSGLAFLKEADRLDALDIPANDASIRSFIKTFETSNNRTKREMRKDLDAAIREAWNDIEKSFAPRKGKYVNDEDDED